MKANRDSAELINTGKRYYLPLGPQLPLESLPIRELSGKPVSQDDHAELDLL